MNVIEFFGGIGAPRKALEKLNIKHKVIDYVEIEKNAVKAYNAIYNENFSPQDINEWDFRKIKKENEKLEIDLLFHGSPCQDFSIAGKQDLSKGRSILYQRVLDILKKQFTKAERPKVVIWENVKNLVSKTHKEHFDNYLKQMEKMGYENHYKVLSALDSGIPQGRERVFCVSIKKSLKNKFDFSKLKKEKMKNLKDFLDYDSFNRKFISPKHLKTAERMEKGNYKNWLNNQSIKNKRLFNLKLYTFDQENRILNIDYENAYCSTITASGASSNQKVFFEIEKNDNKDYQVFEIENKKYLIGSFTPIENWRLMGFDDEDFLKASKEITSIGVLNKLAGNSIVVNCIMSIYKEIFKDKIDKNLL